jgi:hypothetical protein
VPTQRRVRRPLAVDASELLQSSVYRLDERR